MKIISMLITLSLFATTSSAAGLAGGDTYESHTVRGDISVTCFTNEGTTRARFSCGSSYLAPGNFDYFVTDSEVDADKVKLYYKNSRGKTKSKSSKWKGTRSKSRFNLWVWSLTQRPMLNDGENNISYNFSSGGGGGGRVINIPNYGLLAIILAYYGKGAQKFKKKN